jgi:xylitol oxidase
VKSWPPTNWAGSHVIAGRRLHQPRSLDELRAVVAGARNLRVLGTGHTFNDLPDSRGDLVSLASLPPQFELDPRGAVTVGGSARYAEVCPMLDGEGHALEALASLAHISIAGACATGTHGSGDRIRSLATAVRSMDIVTASGDLVRVDGSTHGFAGLVVSLGSIGVVTSLTLDVVPRYEVRQEVFEGASLDTVLGRFDDITAAATSVSLFTTWRDRRFHQVWCKRRVDEEARSTMAELGARPAGGPRHPIPGHDATACTTQLGIPGPWFDRLPHFRADRTPSSGRELQSEYLVGRSDGPGALAALFDAAPRFRDLVQVSEVRTVAEDDLVLSPAFGRSSVAIHFTWEPDPEGVLRAVGVVEEVLAPFDPRPHWGKLWTVPIATVRRSYPRLAEVVALRDRWDPERKFGNRFVDALLGT